MKELTLHELMLFKQWIKDRMSTINRIDAESDSSFRHLSEGERDELIIRKIYIDAEIKRRLFSIPIK